MRQSLKPQDVTLPEGAQEVGAFAELNSAWATIHRDNDGAVYFVTWWYGTPQVQCVVYPNGDSWVREP